MEKTVKTGNEISDAIEAISKPYGSSGYQKVKDSLEALSSSRVIAASAIRGIGPLVEKFGYGNQLQAVALINAIGDIAKGMPENGLIKESQDAILEVVHTASSFKTTGDTIRFVLNLKSLAGEIDKILFSQMARDNPKYAYRKMIIETTTSAAKRYIANGSYDLASDLPSDIKGHMLPLMEKYIRQDFGGAYIKDSIEHLIRGAGGPNGLHMRDG